MMTITETTGLAADGLVEGMIKHRLTVKSEQFRAAAFLEIALLALAEAARCTEDETDEQDAIDDAAVTVRDALYAAVEAG